MSSIPNWITDVLADGEVVDADARQEITEQPKLGELPDWAEPLGEVDYGIIDDSQSIEP